MNDASRKQELLIGLLLLAALGVTLLVSWPALTGPFLFDDFPNLSHLATLGGRTDWGSLGHYSAQYLGQPGRPLSMLSFVLNDAMWPSEPWAFKYTNLMLHLLVGILVFGLARAIAHRHAAQHANGIALLTAAAWLLHPMQLSTSMLVVQRMTQMEGFFALAALWGYVSLVARGRTLAAIVVLGLGSVLATLCKETGALTPLLAMVINKTILRPMLISLSPGKRRVAEWGVALPIAALAVAIGVNWPGDSDFGIRSFNMYERVITECRVLLDYLFKIILPRLGGGGIYHDDFPVSRGLLDPIVTLPAVLTVASLVVAAMAIRVKHPLLSFAVLWFFAGHVLESTVFPLELYFEHRNYIPMLGPLYGLAAFAISLATRSRWRHAFLAGAIAWVALAGWLTSIQAPIWGDTQKLVNVWALEHPDSPRAIQQQTSYLMNEGHTHAAADRMLSAYARGVRGSDFPVQVILIACNEGDPALASRTVRLIPEALRMGEYNNSVLETLGKLRKAVQADRCPQILTVQGWLTMTAELLRNKHYHAGPAQAFIHVERSYLRRYQRDLNATMLELEAAWELSPTPELARLIAATLASAGLFDEALSWAARSSQGQAGGLRGWLSQDLSRAEHLKVALERLKRESAGP